MVLKSCLTKRNKLTKRKWDEKLEYKVKTIIKNEIKQKKLRKKERRTRQKKAS